MDYDKSPQDKKAAGAPQPVVRQPDVIVAVNYGENPLTTTCAYCGNRVTTETKLVNGTKVYLASALICFFGGICGCCFIPFCMDSCKDVEHRCPNCTNEMGKLKRW
ncbi:unnamed protein product [Hymenolepis diminuta]|uniref:LITAF domain-containing protein n=1 Tax=Hymenolepis diminuta TaxID=6216 RepID=A0A564YDE4_HYMDI|nr:unnamed protein product [Hymenolepis diminuta]